MKRELNMQLFANAHPEIFRAWVEFLNPQDTFAEINDPQSDTLVPIVDYSIRSEGWSIHEWIFEDRIVAITTQYSDYGGSVGADLYLLNNMFWPNSNTGRWISSEGATDDSDWAGVVIELLVMTEHT